METSNTSYKGSMLAVDSDAAFIETLERIFQKHFDIRTASNVNKAIDFLERPYEPDVILLSDNINDSGNELLAYAIKNLPNSKRILLTEKSVSKELVALLAQGHIFMYIPKPCEELELIQAMRLAFDNKSTPKIQEQLNQLTEDYNSIKEKFQAYQKYMYESKNILTQTVSAIGGLFDSSEKFYFASHSKNVALIAKTIAERIGFDSDTVTSIVFTSLLSQITCYSLPDIYQLLEPYEMEENQFSIYFDTFVKSLTQLNKIYLFNKYVKILSQIWEHNDGSGFPSKLSGNQIHKEAHVVAIAKIYHNRVYRLTVSDYTKLMEKGKVEQSKEVTLERHNEAVKFLLKKGHWFDYDVFNAFNDLIKKKNSPALMPGENNLVIEFTPVEQVKSWNFEAARKTETKNADNQESADSKEIEISIAGLLPGMIIKQNIMTKNGAMVVRDNTVLDESIINNLVQLEQTGMLTGNLTVLPA